MTGSKRIVHFLSASDRLNYGDLLFPLIFKRILKIHETDVIFYNYAVIRSDLSFFGALPTKSYRKFQRNVNKLGGNVIIGGGEVLFVDWGSLFAFISKFYSKLLFYNYKLEKIERKFNLTKFLLSNGKVLVPFAPKLSEIRNKKPVKIFYNAVGGTFQNSRIRNKKYRFKENLESADFISVRDNRVKSSLWSEGVESIVTPDSALIISDFFKKSFLLEELSFQNSIVKEDYLFLQIGKEYAPKDLNFFSEELLKVAKVLNLKIILCPIGLASRHEDDIILKKLSKISEKFYYFSPMSVFDIMALISHSKLFIGTSLHGVITAQSFSVPFIPLNKQLVKVEEYCKTWAKGNKVRCLDFSEIHRVVEIKENWNYNIALLEKEEQKALVYKNFDEIINGLIS